MSDPLKTLGIGKRTLIENWLKEMEEKRHLNHYSINDDLTIDVNDSVIIEGHKNLTKFPDS